MLNSPYKQRNIVFNMPFLLVFSILLELFFIQSALSKQLERPQQITYQLDIVWKKKIKDGKVIEDKAEPQNFFDEPYQYRIEHLETKEPVLNKFIGKDLMEQKKLVVLNVTSQGNIYLADVSKAGNVFLYSIFPRQKTIAVSIQYWWSYEDVVILWQGFGKYH
ncbi:MAG: hypothetical protein GF353_04730 [Candidatus Lokiarchaeota archaeon]|nr:hypothetical protein [Candidatus Lokiarchaeota archaeon]